MRANRSQILSARLCLVDTLPGRGQARGGLHPVTRTLLRIEGPLGSFFLREDSDRPIILMGGGTGFAPLKGQIEQAFEAGVSRPMVLYWGVRAQRDLYMGELPEALDTPRRDTPRTHIPKGSVAIAQRQTGIYPVVSPGGWQIIGRTPLELFDARQASPSLLSMGDQVRFVAISAEEAEQWPG